MIFAKQTTAVINFVDRHKVAATAIATATVTTVVVSSLQRSALAEAYEFIDAAGLTEKFIDSVPAAEIYN